MSRQKKISFLKRYMSISMRTFLFSSILTALISELFVELKLQVHNPYLFGVSIFLVVLSLVNIIDCYFLWREGLR